jgi:uncharacterized membrane protein
VVRAVVAVSVGVVVAVVVGGSAGWGYAPAAGWIAAATVFLIWTWSVIGRMTAERTAAHATREDPTRAMTDLIIVSASVASLAGVGYLLVAEAQKGGGDSAAVVGIGSVAAAWFTVHTVFTVRYARLYYLVPVGGVDFNQDETPAYVDFAYLAFTIGMTYQVSDTDLQSRIIRVTALRQAMLSYLLGAVVLAITINLVVGLGNANG